MHINVFSNIYICCHLHTDCFVVSQLFSVARHVGRLKMGSKPVQLYVRLSIIPLGQQAYHVGSGIIKSYVVTAAATFVLFTIYTLPDIRVLNSFEELCIIWAAADNSFARVLNPHGGAYIYIYIYMCVCVCVCVCVEKGKTEKNMLVNRCC